MSDFRTETNFAGGMIGVPVVVQNSNSGGVRSTNGGGTAGNVAARPGGGDGETKNVAGGPNLGKTSTTALSPVSVSIAVASSNVPSRGLRNCDSGSGEAYPADGGKSMAMETAPANCPIEMENLDQGTSLPTSLADEEAVRILKTIVERESCRSELKERREAVEIDGKHKGNDSASLTPGAKSGSGTTASMKEAGATQGEGGGGGGPGTSPNPGGKYVDIYREKPIRVTVKVLVPVKEHPKFNFVGKLLGPKGNSMKRLQEETMTKMAVLGRGSMRDKLKESELRACGDPKYSHLNEELHVEVTGYAAPAEAHARVAYALAALRKYLIPDNNDEIRQQQMREMEILSSMQQEPQLASSQLGVGEDGEGVGAGLEGGDGPPGLLASAVDAAPANGGRAVPLGLPRRPVRAGGSVRGRFPPLMRGGGAAGGMPVRGGGGGIVAPMRKPPPPHLAPPGAVLHPRPSPTKQKVMSILERARAVMEESYGMEGVRAPGADEDGAEEVGGGGLLGGRGGGGLYYGAYNTYDPTGYGGYEDYDDGTGDYYDSADCYTDGGAGRWKGFKVPAGSGIGVGAVDRHRFRPMPYARPK